MFLKTSARMEPVPAASAGEMAPRAAVLVLNHGALDVFIHPNTGDDLRDHRDSALWLGRFLWKRGDGDVIDGSLNGVALGIVPFFTKLAGRWQSGYVFTYAFAMVLGIAALLTWMTLTVGH